MIQRPRRSVTFFFVPLIDVLILLFCIFLLMPYATSPTTPTAAKFEDSQITSELPATVLELQRELERAKREIRKLTEGKGDLAQRISVRILLVNPDDGVMYYHHDGKTERVTDQREAQRLIDLHKKLSGLRDPFFVLLRPENSTRPHGEQVEQYERWFKDVPHQFD